MLDTVFDAEEGDDFAQDSVFDERQYVLVWDSFSHTP